MYGTLHFVFVALWRIHIAIEYFHNLERNRLHRNIHVWIIHIYIVLRHCSRDGRLCNGEMPRTPACHGTSGGGGGPGLDFLAYRSLRGNPWRRSPKSAATCHGCRTCIRRQTPKLCVCFPFLRQIGRRPLNGRWDSVIEQIIQDGLDSFLDIPNQRGLVIYGGGTAASLVFENRKTHEGKTLLGPSQKGGRSRQLNAINATEVLRMTFSFQNGTNHSHLCRRFVPLFQKGMDKGQNAMTLTTLGAFQPSRDVLQSFSVSGNLIESLVLFIKEINVPGLNAYILGDTTIGFSTGKEGLGQEDKVESGTGNLRQLCQPLWKLQSL
mmetsp:Transcript_22529/g.51950  ORF Transcript_22529/g.51950 Transcript_22529/m.51950 type:complete len:323 (-) Transcript_22529:590-1558(-)